MHGITWAAVAKLLGVDYRRAAQNRYVLVWTEQGSEKRENIET
jgi:hypothetical protein